MSVELFRRWDASTVEDANGPSNRKVLCQECHAEHGDQVGISARDG